MIPVEIISGNSPLVLGLPHTGTWLSDEMHQRLNDTGLALTDTDWHIDQIYRGLAPQASVVRATFHRYLIDANRDPSGRSLYPGHNTTQLCPTIDFDNRAIYKTGCTPTQADIEQRIKQFHTPYHKALSQQMANAKRRNGFAILFDCHSIRSEIPFLFEDVLPDFNIGTNLSTSCDPRVESKAVEICKSAEGYSTVLNGRFKGGWTTRHYGRPNDGWHAIQLELSQSTYMNEAPPWNLIADKTAQLRQVLKSLLSQLNHLDLQVRS